MMVWLAVAMGGALGATARFALATWLGVAPGRFPLATFCANGLGCFLMGAIYVLVVDKQVLPIGWRPFILVGVLGAFTTFSTFAIEALSLWQTQHAGLAVFYVVASVVTSLLAVWAGYFISELIFQQ